MNYRPEGALIGTASNARYLSSAEGLAEAMKKNIVLESRAAVCTGRHDLIVDLPCGKGVIPRTEGALGVAEGSTRDIALISRVNKPVCFVPTDVRVEDDGCVFATLSRRKVQEECVENYVSKLVPGDVIPAKVSHLEQFGCFVDIGCGVPSMIPIDSISVSRISHPSDRFAVGRDIRAVVRSNENGRICLTHKELLGTWEENAAAFCAGETVSGVVRSVEEYGVFVELAPNLAGLAELKEGVKAGQSVSVYIKAIVPEKMKIKLVIVDVCAERAPLRDFEYFCDADHISSWVYSSESSKKVICSYF